MSGRGSSRSATRSIPDSGSQTGRTAYVAGAYTKDKDDYETVDVTRGADGSKHKEKCHHTHKEVEVTGVMQSQSTPATPQKQQGCDDSSGWGCMWLVWIILIFIIILIIVMAVFWAVKPNCVTRQCDDNEDGCELDLARAALYAFVITFFIVLIGCAIWWCCGSRRY